MISYKIDFPNQLERDIKYFNLMWSISSDQNIFSILIGDNKATSEGFNELYSDEEYKKCRVRCVDKFNNTYFE